MQTKLMRNGLRIPVIGLGTWRLGGLMVPNTSHDHQALTTLRTALNLGYIHIDTAEMYAGGHTEKLIGQAITPYPRQELVITTKVWSSNLRYRDTHKAVMGSLNRLGTDYIDICLIHWPSDNIPLSETFKALNELVERGQVRALGVSNFSVEQLHQAENFAATPIVTNQVPYSLANRAYAKNGVLTYCQEHGILLTAYTPLDGGSLFNHPTLLAIAKEYQVKPAQVALAWLISQLGVITIPMSTRPTHLRENLAAADIELTDADMRALNSLQA